MNENKENKLSPIKQALLAIEKLQEKLKKVRSQNNEPIAVIGMACRFPGADNVDDYWQMLTEGRSGISKVDGRWNEKELTADNEQLKGKMSTNRGGFIKDYDKFDTQFFGISPREAEKMDPQQRLLMEVTWEAFENSLINVEELSGTKTGVFIGISTNDYSLIQFDSLQDDYESIDAYHGSGNASSISANRLSYFFNFHGPSVALDTACSSSLVSTHLACQSLRNGDSEITVAGGVGLILSPHASISFSQAQMLSPDGECKTFDRNANGYVRGEGVGVVILKRLSDAERDGDNILAVIKSSAVNQDGRTNGLTAPNSHSQVKVIDEALKKAQFSANDVGYIETHGTGTKLGDPIEVEALSKIMQDRDKNSKCYLGAVKTNIGHLEAAAGIAGLIKTILVLKNKLIPQNRNFNEINPFIKIDNTPLAIPTENIEWKSDQKRIAGVSSFGFGGTNAHIIVEEFIKNSELNRPNISHNQLLSLSAYDDIQLKILAKKYKDLIDQSEEVDLPNICYSAVTTRAKFNFRLAIPFSDKNNLKGALDNFIHGEIDYSIYNSEQKLNSVKKLAFLFTGQGSQYNSMLKDLFDTNEFIRNNLNDCFEIADKYCSKSLREIMFSNESALINETEFTQPLLFIVEYVLAKYWINLGIKPNYLIGHSIGEFPAAGIAGVFSLEDGIKLTVLRGRLMQSLPKDGTMVAIFASIEIVKEYLKNFQSTVSIAAINGPQNIVISGKSESVKTILENLNNDGVEYKKLAVSHAFHSPLMKNILSEFKEVAKTINYNAPVIPIVSNLTGELLSSENIPDAEYWTKHIENTVQFEDGIKKLEQLNCNIFVEVGPAPVLTAMSRKCIDNSEKLFLTSVNKNENSCKTINQCLAQFFINDFQIDWNTLYPSKDYYKVQLPTYPFKKERYYFDLQSKTSLRKFNSKKFKGYVKFIDDNNKAKLRLIDEDGNPLDIDEIEIKILDSNEDFKPNDIKDQADNTHESYEIETFSNRIELSSLSPSAQLVQIEKQIRSELGKVLRLNPKMIDNNKSISHLGLDSIMAIEVKNSVEKKYNLTIPIAEIMKGPSVTELAIIIQSSFNADKGEILLEHVPLTENIYDLSYGQKAMWFQHQMAPRSIFNPTYGVKINSDVNIEKFKNALGKIIQRHEVLRTTYSYSQGKPVQIIHDNIELPFKLHNCKHFEKNDLDEYILKYANEEFDLASGPVIKTHLFEYRNNKYIFLISSHHIAVDFWSQAIIVNELSKIYSNDNSDILNDLQYTYTDYVGWQSKLLNSPEGNKQIEYWTNKLSGELHNLNLPTIKPRPATQTFDGKNKHFEISSEVLNKIKKLCKDNNSTIYTFLLASYNIILHKYTHQKDIIIGTPTTGRSLSSLNDLVGYFVNPIPVRTIINSNLPFKKILEDVKTTVIEGIENQDCPINLIVEKVKPERDLSRPPLFQVMFVYQNAHLLKEEGLSGFAVNSKLAKMNLGELEIESYALDDRKSAFEITLLAAETDEGLSLTTTYNSNLFTEKFIEQFNKHFEKLLEEIVSNPLKRIKDLNFVKNLHTTRFKEITDLELVHKKFEKIASKNPDSIAIQFKNILIPYKELNERANQLANLLLSYNFNIETRIGVLIDRSVEMIIAALGIMKAGLVYVPIDTTYPQERIEHILSDASIKMVISNSSFTEKLSNIKVESIELDKNQYHFETQSIDNPKIEIDKNNLAYSIYTSGSTGVPKGVMLTHRGLSNLVDNQIKKFEINSESVVLQFASFGFDASVSEIFTTITQGAKLHLISQEVLLSGSSLINEINNYKITVATLPPSLLSVVPYDKLQSVKTLVSAGETCSKEIVQKWCNGRKFINAYGPTESTVCTTTFNIPSDFVNDIVPIGKAIDGLCVYILDKYLNPVPNYVNGELYISGIGLARGYNNSPDLTASRFLPNPFSSFSGSRMYKTGDLVRRLENKDIEFVGRVDDQVKFRGYRIELGEIEKSLESHLEITKAVVLLSTKNNEKRLIAFYCSKENIELENSDLRNHLLNYLPEYMLPTVFIKVDTFPLTHNGKIDKNKLINLDTKHSRNTVFENPVGVFEKGIITIWKDVLKIEKISTNDNFFDLGGHSLNVIQVQEKIKEKFNKDITVVDLFKYPTVKLFAQFLSNGKDANANNVQSKQRINKQKQMLIQQVELRKRKKN